MREFLSVEKVTKSFGNVCVFRDATLRIRRGEFVTLVGHSGCGKSTLLNIIAGFDRPTSGCVVLDGREVTGPGLDRMVVFQSFALMPWLTASANVRLAVRAAQPRASRDEIERTTRTYLEMMGLRGAEQKRPALLSGGMRQRVGLARAFAVRPKMLLLDEPFAQIDALTRGVIQEELIRSWQASLATVFMVTHDVDEAILLSDRIGLMTSGPNAELAEVVEVDLPRPRTREALIDSPAYARLRAHVLRFLMRGGRENHAQP